MSAFSRWVLRDAEPWQFWRPQSGFHGGSIISLLLIAIALVLGHFL